jgi:glycosyltransferase involved in cell wall biosynthesis
VSVLVARWRRWLARHGSGPSICYVFHPAFVEYARELGSDFLVYHPHDWFEKMSGWTPRLEEAERYLLRAGHLVMAPSPQLADRLSTRAGRDVRVLLNAADVPAFIRAAATGEAPPADLARIPRPRIGYVGQLHPYVDLRLIRRLAQARPAWHFVFIGPRTPKRDPEFESELARCESVPNIHFLGPKPNPEVPRYTVNMDVNIMCYRLDDRGWVGVAYPLKMHEYMASGRPIVSVDLESVRPLQHVIRIARDAGDWERAIEDALTSGGPGTPSSRTEFARAHGWDERATQLEAWLVELVASRGLPSRHPG